MKNKLILFAALALVLIVSGVVISNTAADSDASEQAAVVAVGDQASGCCSAHEMSSASYTSTKKSAGSAECDYTNGSCDYSSKSAKAQAIKSGKCPYKAAQKAAMAQNDVEKNAAEAVSTN